jgi:hypothetical protein
MNNRFHTLKFLGLLLAAGLVSGQAMAQTATATATANAVVIKPITLVKATDLSFGRLASVAGTVSISATDNTRSSTVAANLIAANGTSTPPSRASFTVGGEPNLTYAISAPAATIELTDGSSNKLSVTLTGVYHLNGTASGAAATVSTGTLSSAGADTLGIGGSLTLTDTTPSGTYANSSGISLTVNYN